MYIDPVIHPLQRKSAASHDDSTSRKETNPASSAQHVEDGIRIPSIMLVAFLNPKPVRNGNATTDAQSR